MTTNTINPQSFANTFAAIVRGGYATSNDFDAWLDKTGITLQSLGFNWGETMNALLDIQTAYQGILDMERETA